MTDKERIQKLEDDCECYRWMLSCAKVASDVQEMNLERAESEITPDEAQACHISNLQTLDEMTNWLGHWSDQSIGTLHVIYKKLEGKDKAQLGLFIGELQEIWDGYHTVGGEYPWQT